MLSDPATIVRCAALETLCDILPLVRDFPPSDAKIFPEYILPMLSMLPDDPEESVRICYASSIAKLALTAYGFLIHSLSKLQILEERVLLEMVERAFPLLCYPSEWVRRSAVAFIAASSESLGAVDSYVFLAPVIRHFLRRQPTSLASEKSILSGLKPPVSKQVFYEVLENARGSDMLERQRKIWYNSSAQSKQWETAILNNREDGELDVMESWLGRKPNPEGPKHVFDGLELPEDGKAKFTATDLGSNVSSMADIRDPPYLEKLQFSGYLSPQFGGVSSFMHDKSSGGIPLYSFSMDKQAAKIPAATSDSSLRLNSFGVASSYMPWMDPVNKSFSLTSSVPAPKLVPGSFSITGGSTQFYRVVQEPDGWENDQTSYVNAKFQEMGLSGYAKGTTLSAEDASTSNDLTGVTSFGRMPSVPDSGWRPRGVLVAHLQEHRSAVNDIAIPNDHSFFISASDDSTVKVWDSRKLEKDISFRSRFTYHLEGSRALCTVMLRNAPQVVVGACDGTMHMFSVDHISRGLGNVVEKYSGIADIKRKDIREGAILSVLNYAADDSPSQIVMFSTQNCGIHLWDTRENSNAWTLKAVPGEGYVSSLVAGPCGNWFVSGSSRGVLTLWDLRFLVSVNSWQYSAVCPIENMCFFIPPPTASIASSTRPLVYVAAGCNEVSLWNAENGSCHQVLRVANYNSDAEMSEMPWALARPSAKANFKPDLRRNINPKYRVDELNDPPPRLPGVRSMLPLPGGDFLT